jgi:hypothetical protein
MFGLDFFQGGLRCNKGLRRPFVYQLVDFLQLETRIKSVHRRHLVLRGPFRPARVVRRSLTSSRNLMKFCFDVEYDGDSKYRTKKINRTNSMADRIGSFW